MTVINESIPGRVATLRLLAVTVVASLAVAACAAGPDFHAPTAPAVKGYVPGPAPESTASSVGPAGAPQAFDPSLVLPSDWWTLFHCESLDGLVREGLQHSPSVRAAAASLKSAQENVDAQSAALFFPQAEGQFTANRQRTSPATFGQPDGTPFTYSLYTASVGVSYRVDAFGASRRSVEGLRAAADYQRFELEAAYLALTSNLAAAAISEASYRGQLAALNDTLASQRRTLEIVERQYSAGAASQATVLAQRAQLAATETQLPPLEKALAQNRNRLAVLAGESPDREDLPTFTLAEFTLPTTLPLSVPSELLRDRPDIRAAEALLHEASASVGVATANLYPSITLSASVGSDSAALGDLFKSGGGVWAIGGALTQPLFHAGELRARRRAAIANYTAAEESYKATVLAAFQQVADTLRAIEWDARGLAAATDADAAARDSLALTERQYKSGAVSYLTLLNAQRAASDASRARVQADALRYADSVTLYAALGGGWWSRSKASP